MAMNHGLKSCASKLLRYSTQSSLAKPVNRGIHSTGVKKLGGGHGRDELFYLHAKHMYNLDRMKNQKLTMTLGVLTAFSVDVGVPLCCHISAKEDRFSLKFSLSFFLRSLSYLFPARYYFENVLHRRTKGMKLSFR